MMCGIFRTFLHLAAVTSLVAAGEGTGGRFALSFDDNGDTPQIVTSDAGGIVLAVPNGERQPGRHGSALRFNGRSQSEGGTVVLVEPESRSAFNALLDGPFTMEMWVKFAADCDEKGTYELFTNSGTPKGPGLRLYYTWRGINVLTGDGKAEQAIRTDPLKTTIPLGRWMHLAVTRGTDNVVRLYIDGAEAAASGSAMPVTKGRGNPSFGAWDNAYPFRGMLDEIAIHPFAMSGAEIRRAQQAPAPAEGMRFDGEPDEEFWKPGVLWQEFQVRETGGAPEAGTRVRIRHDQDNLYLAIEADEPALSGLLRKAGDGSISQIYQDDSIEVMIDADGNPESFAHFLFNADGRTAQELRIQTGYVGNPWPNTGWCVRTARGENQWTAEAIIPLAILNKEEALRETLRLNIVRNRRAAEPHQSSSIAGGKIHSAEHFLPYVLKDTDVRPYQFRSGVPKLDNVERAEEEGALIANVIVPVHNAGASPITVDLEARLIASDLGQTEGRKRLRLELKAKEEKTLALALPAGEGGQKSLDLIVSQDEKLTGSDTFPLNVDFTPLSITLSHPAYRNTIYATDPVTEIRGKVTSGLPESDTAGSVLEVEMADATHAVLGSVKIPFLARNTDFVLPFPKEAGPGTYPLTARILKDGQVLAKGTAALTSAAPAAGSEVRTDAGRILWNGKPFLPVVFWGDVLDGVREMGANTFLTTATDKKTLSAMEAAGVRALVYILTGDEIEKYVKNQSDYAPELRAIVEARVQAVKDHPNLFGWFLLDEPDNYGRPELARKIYRHIRDLDPHHPVLITNDSLRGLREFSSACDIPLPDPYILPVKNGPMLKGMKFVETFLDACRELDGKAYGLTVQAFNYGLLGQHNGRAPSFTEQRCQDYLAIVLGARALVFYSSKFFYESADLHVGVPAILKELHSIEQVILEGTEKPLSASPPHLRVTAWEHKGHWWVIACNPLPTATRGTIQGVPDGMLHVYSEDRNVSSSGNAFDDHFAPFGVNIYTTDPDARSPISLPEVRRNVQDAGGLFSAH